MDRDPPHDSEEVFSTGRATLRGAAVAVAVAVSSEMPALSIHHTPVCLQFIKQAGVK